MITHTFETPVTIATTITGFHAQKVEAQPEGAWQIRAEMLTAGGDPAGVRTRPIIKEVTVQREEVAAALGIDTEAEGWEDLYGQTPLAGLQNAVVAAAVGKVLGQ